MHKEIIKDIGEKELIKRIAKYMPINQTSDDCAFLETESEDLLINTDLMVENTHFNHKIISPRDIGWKAVTTNYSDLISSGCIEFIGINIGLVLTPYTEWQWVHELYEGFNEALNHFKSLENYIIRCNNSLEEAIKITPLYTDPNPFAWDHNIKQEAEKIWQKVMTK